MLISQYLLQQLGITRYLEVANQNCIVSAEQSWVSASSLILIGYNSLVIVKWWWSSCRYWLRTSWQRSFLCSCMHLRKKTNDKWHCYSTTVHMKMKHWILRRLTRNAFAGYNLFIYPYTHNSAVAYLMYLSASVYFMNCRPLFSMMFDLYLYIDCQESQLRLS